jgi:hypothetical protein
MMLEKKTTEFLEVLSSAEPVPGGGGASATVGALACALGMMVANLTIGKKKYADVEEEVKSARDSLNELMKELVDLTDEDAKVFEPLSKAYGLPKETKEQQEYKEKVLEEELYKASIVPMNIMETVLKAMKLLDLMGEKGSLIAISDVGVGILFAQAALEGASLNIYINAKLMKDKAHKEEMESKADAIIAESNKIKDKVFSNVMGKIRPA